MSRFCYAVTLALVMLPCAAFGEGATPAARGADGAPAHRDQSPKQLADQAIKLLADGHAGEAAALLDDAVRREPASPAYAFLHACALARAGDADRAMDELERAANIGFTGFAGLASNAHLRSLRRLPRFRRLIADKDKYLRRTAEGTLVALRNRFGDDGYQYAVDGDARLVFAVAADAAAFDQLRAALREQADALHADLFAHKPEAYVAVVLPTAADYGKLVRFRNVPGLYVDATKSLVARERGTYVLPHEYTHALHAADLAPLGQTHAPWVVEGLGVLAESATFAGGTFAPRPNPRFSTLPYAARRKGLVPLDRLVAMDQKEFVRRPNLTYGQSGSLMLYLWEKKLLREFYDTYKKTYATDPTGRAALEKVTGKTVSDVHEDWRLWLVASVETPATTRPQ